MNSSSSSTPNSNNANTNTTTTRPRTPLVKTLFQIILFACIGLIGLISVRTYLFIQESNRNIQQDFETRIKEGKSIHHSSSKHFQQLNWDEKERNSAIHRLQRAIQFPTIHHVKDYEIFQKLFDQMFKDFPLLFEGPSAVLKEVTHEISRQMSFNNSNNNTSTSSTSTSTNNSHSSNIPSEDSILAARVFVWRSNNHHHKLPIMLTGHVDVVPINDESKWTYPPFSGMIVNEGSSSSSSSSGSTIDSSTSQTYLYGRGSLDDKNGVYEILEALNQIRRENLLQQPDRDIYVVIGMDEEIGGEHGAKKVTSYFLKKNIKFSFILDEGGMIADHQFPTIHSPVAFVANAEKGFCNFEIRVQCEPGHSSMPKPNSCIHMLSKAMIQIQSNPMKAHISILRRMIHQLAPLSNSMIFKIVAANMDLFAPFLDYVLSYVGGAPNAVVRTTFAPTIISAGVAENVLPSTGTLLVNTRLAPYDSIQDVLKHLEQVVLNVATKTDSTYSSNLTVTALPKNCDEASRVSCHDCLEFNIIKKSIHQMQPDVFVVPYLFIAGSDSKHYRKLSDYAYGYLPMRLVKAHDDLARIHGHNERISTQNYLESVNVYTAIILNANEMLKDRP
ncbi:hypothetical protein C9374_008412 [Naegleria lovaniensis]|uniref:Peptidase M20 dimerisation domain-containing protein n=1 Tax=Naegleria lovaniensis TaxID=51637 RepID=A0AA88KKX8_NAELO|nr:uncharacterized protein C9374_008412 [Naegleria lovaniensis]KAG2378269.1 hypothetical protein C9374_008412 [Naegleria lovaniensis]